MVKTEQFGSSIYIFVRMLLTSMKRILLSSDPTIRYEPLALFVQQTKVYS